MGKLKEKRALITVFLLTFLLTALSACGSDSANASSNKQPEPNHSTKNAANPNKPYSPPNSQDGNNPSFQTSLTLPNGKVIKQTNQSVRWKNLSIQLLITSLPPAPASKEGYRTIIGNHSTIISHEKVSTSAGKAKLVLNKRTQSAAAHSKETTYEYWVVVNKSHYAYAIKATIVGKRNNARNEVIQLLNQWKVSK